MAHFQLLKIKAGNLSSFEAIWLFASMILIISSTMCLAVAAMSLVLPSANMVMMYLLLASLASGLAGYASIKILQKRQNLQECFH